MKIDRNKLEEQRREAALKSGKYALFEIIVPTGELNPITNLHLKKCSSNEIGVIIKSLKVSYELMVKRFPEAKLIEKYLKTESAETLNAKNSIVDIDESEG